MPRANRFFVPEHVWHITHRCHKKEFLLKFARDRQRWVHWLHKASRRYRVSILNFTVTSNHIHLVVWDNNTPSEIPDMVQLVAGRVAQEYNQWKHRRGAFWEDRYHATAIETGSHLWRCLVYVDLNMVRAGVVRHPEEWAFSGYHEIVGSKKRNTILDRRAILKLLELNSLDVLESQYQEITDEALARDRQVREESWSESLAVGGRDFITGFQDKLRTRGKRRKIAAEGDGFIIREGLSRYGAVFGVKNEPIASKNALLWGVIPVKTEG